MQSREDSSPHKLNVLVKHLKSHARDYRSRGTRNNCSQALRTASRFHHQGTDTHTSLLLRDVVALRCPEFRRLLKVPPVIRVARYHQGGYYTTRGLYAHEADDDVCINNVTNQVDKLWAATQRLKGPLHPSPQGMVNLNKKVDRYFND
ncbi:hypothetical protein E2C01_007533 [Portunus trituberculatus]|uniref:Uncharacterized protein n=1 Tax=Portunus trituberculatus TaxID=210409 RepID=A0A5B7D0Q5_PORTR|nr:hypothetical protein [Portunus trituberculatus]